MECAKSSVDGKSVDTEGMMILGKEIENPYSISYMRMALEEMKKSNVSKAANDCNLEANCLYVRFLPTNREEFEILVSDSTIELFDYPLLNEIEVEGDYYHDPSLPVDAITWQYTTVPVNYTFPNVKYEILDSCFIPDAYEQTISKKTSNLDTDNLTYIAFKLAGQEEEYLRTLSKKRESPSGQFRVYDNYKKSFVGIAGVKVRVSNFIRWACTYTDNDGNYEFDKHFSIKNMRYHIKFQTEDSIIINNLMFDVDAASKNLGKHPKSGYSEDFKSDTSKVWMWATVNNAVQIFKKQLCPKFDIPTPNIKLHIFASKKQNKNNWEGCTPMARHMSIKFANWQAFCIHCLGFSVEKWIADAIAPDMTIFHNTATQKIYSNVFHEMSHVCHYMKVGKDYWQPYVKFILTHYGYGQKTDNNSGYVGVGEMWGYYFGNYVCDYAYFNKRFSWNPQEDWFKPGIMEYLQTDIPLHTRQIYNVLTPDVTSHELLKQELLKTYNNEKIIKDSFFYFGF